MKKVASMARKSARRMSSVTKVRRILAIDVGGTGLKAAIVGPTGKFLSERQRVKTPHKCQPDQMVKELAELVATLGTYDHISIGFPGYVRDGKVITAPHFGTENWAGFPLAAVIAKKLGAPTRLTNDADIQGLGVIKGTGLELVCTLGTGFGTAWFRDGELMPHMDLAHFTVKKKDDLDRYVGDETRKDIGHGQWNKRVAKVIAMLATVMNYDQLYLGGGNSRHVKFKLPRNVSIVSNDAGMEGSAFVWRPRHRTS
jgi:polyphosphate glucokinase